MALKRLPYAADITVCLPRRSTFKLRGIVKNIHQLSAANPLSLVVSLDWCVNTFPGFAASTAEKVLCVLCRTSSSQKKEGKLCIFSRHNCPLCIRLNVIATLLSEWPQTDKHKKPLNICAVMSLEDKCTQTAPNEQQRHQCDFCEKSYKNKSHLSYHVKTTHYRSSVKKPNYRFFQCRVCHQGRKKHLLLNEQWSNVFFL